LASPFYHKLHIVQLRVMHRLTGSSVFAETADRWEQYGRQRLNRARAIAGKAVFKIFYY
jgi:heparosan-N-sulfate-glucuronate 5-epimerase